MTRTTATSATVGWVEYLLWFLLVVALALAVLSYWWSGTLARQDQRFVERVQQQRTLSQALARQALAAASGHEPAFQELQVAREGLARAASELGRVRARRPHAFGAPDMGVELAAVESAARQVDGAVNRLLGDRDPALQLWRNVSDFEAFAADTLLKSDELVNVMVETGASPEQVYAATRQLMLLERLAHNLRRTLSGGANADEAAERFDRDVVHFRQVTQGLLAGDEKLGIEAVADSEARALLADIVGAMGGEREEATAVLVQAEALTRTRKAAAHVGLAVDTLSGALDAVMQVYHGHAGTRRLSGWAGHAFAMLAALLMGVQMLLAVRRRAPGVEAPQAAAQPKETQDCDRENPASPEHPGQAAMLRLMEEVGTMPERDSAFTATDASEAAGVPAEAIDEAAGRIRELVTRAGETVACAEALVAAAGVSPPAEARAGEPLRATQAGTAEEAGAQLDALTRRLLALTGEHTLVTTRLAETLDATQGSVRTGTLALQRAVERCREAESLAALVNDLGDQANILALNTAIQASAKGGTGADSCPVADDVQRLAERLMQFARRVQTQMSRIGAALHEAGQVAVDIRTGMDASARATKEVEKSSAQTSQALGKMQSLAGQLNASRGAEEPLPGARASQPAGEDGSSLAGRDLSNRLGELSQAAETLKRLLAEFPPLSGAGGLPSRRPDGGQPPLEAGESERKQELPATLGLQEEARTG
ncbi:MAG: methyl-accepting chemotaxis protein [Gammaproteobacteria bacterium]|nr:methyl-accepting chemotaxis protein [Gammaproteobacteria bacterium]